MQVFSISGGKELRGIVDVGGSKNSALSLLAAVVLSEGEIVLHNVPHISDTRLKTRLLENFGAKVQWDGNSVAIDCSKLSNAAVEEDLVRSIRTSFFLLGPLLARLGTVSLPAPGGCQIGARPVDFHLQGLHQLGGNIEYSAGVYRASTQGFHGAEMYLKTPSPGATQHLMTSAVLAKGCTVIQNAAMEPEVTTLASFLNAMGARIEGAGTSRITITGVESLSGTEFNVPADRMQASTYLIAGAITKGDVTVRNVLPETQIPVINHLRETGADVDEGHDWVRVSAQGRLRGTRVRTLPYPGFPTDVQQPMAALLAVCQGTSIIEETVYESRIGHIQELNRMGANIELPHAQTSIINGVERLQGTTVQATDLRAGAALVLAGLAAEGETVVRNIHHIDRGYEKLEATLIGLGGRIERVNLPENGFSKADPIS